MKNIILILLLMLTCTGLLAQNMNVKKNTNEVTFDGGKIFSDVSSRFKVAPSDYSVNNACTPLTWYDAVKAGERLEMEGEKGWRLPTKHELMLLYAVNSKLKNPLEISNGAIPSCFYWTSTEKSNAHAWFVTYLNGQSSAFNKKYFCRVRLVKDIK